MFRNKNVLLLGSIGLIVLAIGLVAILDRTSSTSSPESDIRARAATVKTLQMNGTVTSIDQTNGSLTVDNMYFADVSRSGEATNLGTWVVTVPANFNLDSVSPGTNVVIGIDDKTLLANKHTVTALTIVPGTK